MRTDTSQARKVLFWLGGLVVAGFVGAWISAFLAKPTLGSALISPDFDEPEPEAESDTITVSVPEDIIAEHGGARRPPCCYNYCDKTRVIIVT